MRRAKSYGIVDHELLQGKYLHRLSHEAMSLYLFLCVVSDKEGKSFYGERTITDILRIDVPRAIQDLVSLGLLDYRRPFFWLKNLAASRGTSQADACKGRQEIL